MSRASRSLLGTLLVLVGCATVPRDGAAPNDGVTPELAVKPAAPDLARGPLVLSIVIDQLGSETLTRLEPLLHADGAFARARANGRVYGRVVYPFIATLTAPGHAAIYSGATPSESGITANSRLDTATGTKLAMVDDRVSGVHGVPDEHAAPTAMRVATVGDALKQASDGRGKVVSISMKDRSAILPAGKQPDRVLWFETSLRAFTTSSYYASALPQWLTAHTIAHPVSLDLRWEPLDAQRLLAVQGPDDAPGEGPPAGLKTTFPHLLAHAKDAASTWLLFPQSTDALLELALAASEQEQLCTDDVPDLLAVSISGTDLVGHAFGPSSWEYADALQRADLGIARLVDQLEKRCKVSVLITSDHGVAPLPEQSGGKRVPSDLSGRIERVLQDALGAPSEAAVAPGTKKGARGTSQPTQTAPSQPATDAAPAPRWLAGFDAPYLYFTVMGSTHKSFGKARELALATLAAVPGVREGIDTHDLEKLEARSDLLSRQALASIHPEVSGDILVVNEARAVPAFGSGTTGTTHGSPYEYDTEVPVLVWGPGITPARHLEAFDQRRVASTLAALLGVPAPHPQAPPPLPGVE